MDKSGFSIEEADKIFLDFSIIFIDNLVGLEKILREGDFKAIQKIAHQLKGSSSNLRIEPIRILAEKLDVGSKNKNKNECRETIQELVKYREIFQKCPIL